MFVYVVVYSRECVVIIVKCVLGDRLFVGWIVGEFRLMIGVCLLLYVW